MKKDITMNWKQELASKAKTTPTEVIGVSCRNGIMQVITKHPRKG